MCLSLPPTPLCPAVPDYEQEEHAPAGCVLEMSLLPILAVPNGLCSFAVMLFCLLAMSESPLFHSKLTTTDKSFIENALEEIVVVFKDLWPIVLGQSAVELMKHPRHPLKVLS